VSDDKNSLQRISEIAEQRRSEARKSLEKAIPSYILEIRQTEVAYTVNSVALPLSQMNSDLFLETLRERYNIRYKMPDLGLGAQLNQSTQFSESQVLGLVLKQDTPTLRFEDGRLNISGDFTTIVNITLNRETIHVAVRGKSQAADLIVAEVAEAVWHATGVDKRWDEIKKNIQLISYGTGTLVDLGFPFENLVSSDFRDKLASNALEGKKYGAEMGGLSARDGFNQPKDSIVVQCHFN